MPDIKTFVQVPSALWVEYQNYQWKYAHIYRILKVVLLQRAIPEIQ